MAESDGRQCVWRVRHDTQTIDAFFFMPNIRCMTLVPAVVRTEQRHMICCGLSAVFVVSSAGQVSLLAGDVRLVGDADGPGSLARFANIVECVFDVRGRLLVHEAFNERVVSLDTGFVSRRDPGGTYDTPSLDQCFRGAKEVSLKSRVFQPLAHTLCTHHADGKLPATHSSMHAFARDVLHDRVLGCSPYLLCCRTLSTEPTTPTLILFDALRDGVEEKTDFASAKSPPTRTEFTQMALENDATLVPRIVSALDAAMHWPPGLSELVSDYARPGLCVLAFDVTTCRLLRIPTGCTSDVRFASSTVIPSHSRPNTL
jgi:hypothetical protein